MGIWIDWGGIYPCCDIWIPTLEGIYAEDLQQTTSKATGIQKEKPMKWITVLLALLAMIIGGVLSPSLTLPQEDSCNGDFKCGSEPDGFRDIQWGTEISTLKDMVFVMAFDKDAKRYERKGDELKIGKAKLDYIHYEFRKGKFCLAEMWFHGIENFNHAKEALFETYGEGRNMSEKTESYLWEGEKTDIMLIFNAKIGGGITISSKEF